MTLTKEQAVKYYAEKKNLPIRTIREFGIIGKEDNFFIINDNYIIRYIIPEAMNCFMRNQNFEPRISGAKITKADMLFYMTSNKFYAKSNMNKHYLVYKYSRKGPNGDYPEPFKGRYAWREWAEFATEEEAKQYCLSHSGTFKYTTIYKQD